MTAEQRVDLSSKTAKYAADVRACLGSKKSGLISLLEEITGKPRPDLQKEFGTDAVIFDSYSNVSDALFGLTRIRSEELRKMQKDYDFANIRYFSEEELCDDIAVRVGRKAGFDKMSLAQLVFVTIEAFQTGASGECRAILENGLVPNYALYDFHRSPCYRAFHIKQFNDWLDKSGG